MKNKLIPILFLICVLPTVFAIPDITINSVQYQDRNGDTISVASKTGDVLIVDVSVIQNSEEVKRVYLAWGETSWVDCRANSGNKYTCILTVTPFMSELTDVYLIVGYNENGENKIEKKLVGTYDFKGEMFPVYLPPERPKTPTQTVTTQITPTITIVQSMPTTKKFCERKPVCTKYEQTCDKICARTSANGKYCYQYKLVCKKTENCLRYTDKMVCVR